MTFVHPTWPLNLNRDWMMSMMMSSLMSLQSITSKSELCCVFEHFTIASVILLWEIYDVNIHMTS